MQLESEQFQSSLENANIIFLLVIPFVIDIMNSVHSLQMNLLMDLTTEFIPSLIPLVKMARHLFFFLLCFNFFSL